MQPKKPKASFAEFLVYSIEQQLLDSIVVVGCLCLHFIIAEQQP